MKKAVFLDRDGVLCKDTDYITSFKKLDIFEYSKEAVHIIKNKGFLVIVVSNQSAVARGMMTEKELEKINNYIKNELNIDEIYYCPHLPPDGEEDEPPYRMKCTCRKPDIGMIEYAQKRWEIDLKQSYMVGDRETDIIAGKKANLKTVRILNTSIHINDDVIADMQYKTVFDFAMTL